jgi:DNA-binding GntR family transcriptional regulator
MEPFGAAMTFQTKSEAVYNELKRRILDGTIPPGMSLNQDRLAAEFGVSTTPLREAMRRLESEGLVVSAAHKDVVVSAVRPDDLAAIYEVRRELDALAVGLAASRHDAAEAATIRAACDVLSGSTVDALDANRRFHRAIYAACHNPVLTEELDRLWDRSDRHRRLLRDIADDHDVLSEHLAIAEAVLARRDKQAAKLMRRHVGDALRLIQFALSEE